MFDRYHETREMKVDENGGSSLDFFSLKNVNDISTHALEIIDDQSNWSLNT